MSLNFVFTVDGDWDEYFSSKLPAESRKPSKNKVFSLIQSEIKLAKEVLGGKLLHFVHTSPLVRDFFLQPQFIGLWKQLEAGGGDVGVHCHEEELYDAWYAKDEVRMEKVISYFTEGLREGGLNPLAYRGGFLAFSSKVIPILEKNQLFLDFSCDPGRHLFVNNILVSDWQGAPDNVYRLSYEDHRKPGISKVFEIPLGIYIEKQSLFGIWKKARDLKKKPGLRIVSVLAHTYDFNSFKMRLKIKILLGILKIYGKFINVSEIFKIVK